MHASPQPVARRIERHACEARQCHHVTAIDELVDGSGQLAVDEHRLRQQAVAQAADRAFTAEAD